MSTVVSRKARQLAAVLVEQLGRQQARTLTREGRQAVATALAWTGTGLELVQVLVEEPAVHRAVAQQLGEARLAARAAAAAAKAATLPD